MNLKTVFTNWLLFAFIINFKWEGIVIKRARKRVVPHAEVSRALKWWNAEISATAELAVGDILGLGGGCVSQLWGCLFPLLVTYDMVVLIQVQGNTIWYARLKDLFSAESTSNICPLATDSPHPTAPHPLPCLLTHFFPELPPQKKGGNLVNKTGFWYWLRHSPPCLTCRDLAVYTSQNLHLESQHHLEGLGDEPDILSLFSAL